MSEITAPSKPLNAKEITVELEPTGGSSKYYDLYLPTEVADKCISQIRGEKIMRSAISLQSLVGVASTTPANYHETYAVILNLIYKFIQLRRDLKFGNERTIPGDPPTTKMHMIVHELHRQIHALEYNKQSPDCLRQYMTKDELNIECTLSPYIVKKILEVYAPGSAAKIIIGDVINTIADNDFDAGNIIKAGRRIIARRDGIGKKGASIKYDADKMHYFTDQMLLKY